MCIKSCCYLVRKNDIKQITWDVIFPFLDNVDAGKLNVENTRSNKRLVNRVLHKLFAVKLNISLKNL